MPDQACIKRKDKTVISAQHSHNPIKYEITYGYKGEEKFIRVFHVIKN